MVSAAEKSTGRGSGGIQGRGAGGGRQSAANTAKEQMEATSYAAGIAGASADKEEEDLAEEELEALANGLGMEPKEPKKKEKKVAPVAAAAPIAQASLMEVWEEEKPMNLKTVDNWEDAADELDIDAI